MSMNVDAECLASRLAGVLPAVPTPFRDDEVDLEAFSAFCGHLLTQGVDGLVVCGTTGEGTALKTAEYAAVVAAAGRRADGRAPVVAGICGLATAVVIARARAAEAAGADALLAAAPPYALPTQAGLLAHFTALHDAVELPIILYDVPGRTSVALSIELIEALSGLPRVLGLKDASGNLARPVRIRAKAGPAFIQLSGDDATFLAHLAQGGVGCISVTANVAPACCAALLSAWRSGDRTEAARLRDALDPLHAALFIESNPIPVKEALAQHGHMNSAARLPLQRAARSTQEAISRALRIVMPVERKLARTEQRAAA